MINKKVGLFALLFIVSSFGLASAQTVYCPNGLNGGGITCTSGYQAVQTAINSNSVNGLSGISDAVSIFVLALGIIVVLAVLYVFAIKILLPFLK
jgi:hypothetical protein